MNPFTIHGDRFLGLWALGWLVVVGVVLALRKLLQRPAKRVDIEELERRLRPTEIAYVVDGVRRAVEAAVAGLHHRGLVKIVADEVHRAGKPGQILDKRGVYRGVIVDEPHGDAERYVLSHLPGTMRQLEYAPALDAALREKLVAEHLVVAQPQVKKIIMWILPGAWIALGAVRFVIDLVQVNSVFVLLCSVVVATLACRKFLRPPHRTWNGSALVAKLVRENRGLEATAKAKPSLVSSTDMMLAYALFGPLVLDSAIASIMPTYVAAKAAGGSSTGCGGCGSACGSSCGGGCGGGCGGCG